MSNDNTSNFFIHLDWNDATERLLAEWADIASCYVWIYDKGYRQFNRLNYKYSIPIIVLSTVTGTLSMSLNTILPEDQITTGQVVLGGINIFTGIITTLQNFFKYAQQSESHLNASTEWAKFERNIKIELSIERHNRKPAPDFIRIARHDYEKLLNNNPIIPVDIIQEFKEVVKDLKISKPILIKSLEATRIYSEVISEEKISPTKISYLKRLASLIPGTRSYRQANGESPLGKLELFKSNGTPNSEAKNRDEIVILNTPRSLTNVSVSNKFSNDYLLLDTDAALRKIASDTANDNKNRSPSQNTTQLSMDIIKENLSRNGSIEEQLNEEKVTVSTPQDPYTELDDILVEPVVHP